MYVLKERHLNIPWLIPDWTKPGGHVSPYSWDEEPMANCGHHAEKRPGCRRYRTWVLMQAPLRNSGLAVLHLAHGFSPRSWLSPLLPWRVFRVMCHRSVTSVQSPAIYKMLSRALLILLLCWKAGPLTSSSFCPYIINLTGWARLQQLLQPSLCSSACGWLYKKTHIYLCKHWDFSFARPSSHKQ